MLDVEHVLRQQLTVFDQPEPQFMHHLQGFQVVAANFIGDIAGPAGCALINDIQNPVGISTLAVQERQGNREAATCGVTVKIVISYTGAAFSEPPAFYLVKRNPFAVGALAAPLHIGFIVF
jgi:hypothetical protein